MKQALLLLTMILPISQAFGQDLDEQAARKKAEYDYAYATALNAAVYGWAPFIMDVSMKLQTSVDAPMDNGSFTSFCMSVGDWDFKREKIIAKKITSNYFIVLFCGLKLGDCGLIGVNSTKTGLCLLC